MTTPTPPEPICVVCNSHKLVVDGKCLIHRTSISERIRAEVELLLGYLRTDPKDMNGFEDSLLESLHEIEVEARAEERQKEPIKILLERIDELKKQLSDERAEKERLKNGLEEYANMDNWKDTRCETGCTSFDGYWEKAREILNPTAKEKGHES